MQPLKQFEKLVATGTKELDNRLLDLLKSGFFNNYQLFTEQVFLVLDQQTFKYAYVSDNIETMTGFSKDFILEEGLLFLQYRYHPDDLDKIEKIFKLVVDKFKEMTENEVLSSCLTYDYRVLFADDKYHRVLQHSIPLTCDSERNVAYCLIIAMDIGDYKKGDYSGYKIQVNKEGISKIILEGVVGESAGDGTTKREKEIIRLTAEGLTEKQIAERLAISVQTVKSHRKNLIQKTGARNAAELVKYGVANNIV